MATVGPVRRIGLLLGALAVLVSGCAAVGGPPEPAERTALELPPRPRDVRIDGIEPCSLLTEAQRADLGLDGEPSSSTEPSVLFGGDEPACVDQRLSSTSRIRRSWNRHNSRN